MTRLPVVLSSRLCCCTSLPRNSWRSKTSSDAVVESVSQDLRFCVVVPDLALGVRSVVAKAVRYCDAREEDRRVGVRCRR